MPSRTDAPRSPTAWFLAATLALLLVFLAALGVPLAARWLAETTGVDPLRWLGSGSAVGVLKLRALRALAAACLGLNLLLLLAWLRRPGQAARALICLAVVPAYLTGVGLIDHVHRQDEAWRVFWRLDVESGSLPAGFVDRQSVLAAGVRDADSFARFADERFERLRGELAAAWRTDDDDTLRATFYLNLVSRMWNVGNREHPGRVGCVTSNEETGFVVTPRAELTFGDYLDSRIACCTDYATVLEALLDRAGIDNRVVVVPGHVFNEARLGGEWRALDPMLALMFRHPWGGMVEGTAPIRAVVFPHHNMDPDRPEGHRPAVGSFRMFQLYRAAGGTREPYRYLPDVATAAE